MQNYINVEVSKLANIYFEGKVISRNIFFKNGLRRTLGVMLEGEYEFKTESIEIIEINSGNLNLKIEGEDEWKLITEGMEFSVPKNSAFKLKVLDLVNYSCTYIDN